jgi:hypothetical protein
MPTSPAHDRRLLCDRCGCVLTMTADELIRFSRGEWPRCCLLPMVLELDNQSVRPNDGTEVERPTRRGRTSYRV